MAFILTWNPKTRTALQGDSEVDLMARHFLDSDEPIEGDWSTRRRHGFEAGDRVYLVAVGAPQRGIVASGTVSDPEARTGPHWSDDGTTAYYIDIDWDAAVFPEESLPTATLKEIAPHTNWAPQSSGAELRDDPALVEEVWQAHLEELGLDAMFSDPHHSPLDPAAKVVEVPREYTTTFAKVRRHQKRFRQILLNNYDHRCFYCGLDVIEILEAAHLESDSAGGAASVENGRLLCANHHRAYDAQLLRWSGSEFYPADDAPDVLPDPQES